MKLEIKDGEITAASEGMLWQGEPLGPVELVSWEEWLQRYLKQRLAHRPDLLAEARRRIFGEESDDE